MSRQAFRENAAAIGFVKVCRYVSGAWREGANSRASIAKVYWGKSGVNACLAL
jgi:hypothetical protein